VKVGCIASSPVIIYHNKIRAGILNNLWGLGTEKKKGYRSGPPGYVGWRNSFLEIDSWAS
jgi:hypothetical protein